jgi:hypothetical protein
VRFGGEAQAGADLRSVAFERIGELLGVVSASAMAALDQALRLHLAL